ncbi:diguanylate cyclase [Fusibacter ferrireducens]|uniref:Diguanylate cyclase n=1 Tax=Fusibacter ferrireducens TaxID=2785058 RepID=A0ABR9ZWG4_9FIRM|nr:diguanylate cyclase [Fusibacter ferrireducens]MBF4694795.1 diguanylate cyclase [Fusibacter ferrireducens]
MRCNNKCLANIILIILLIIASIIQLNSAYIQEKSEMALRSIYISKNLENHMISSVHELELLGTQLTSTMTHDHHFFDEELYSDGKNYEIVGKSISVMGIKENETLKHSTKDEIADILINEQSFIRIKENLSNIEWIYYLSQNNFISIYPKTTSKAETVIPITYDFEFFQIVTPEINPDKEIKFTKVYEDQLGKGAMITISMPIYKADQFMGALSIDYTLEGLSDLIKYESNEMMNYVLINEYDQVVATNSNIIEGKYQNTNEYLSSKFGIDLYEVEKKKGELFTNGDYFITIIPLENVPFDVYVIVNRMTFYIAVASKIMPIIFSLIGVIIILSLYFKTVNINASLEKSERKFKYVFDQSVSYAIILDANGNIVYANQQALHVIGKNIEDVRGQYFPNSAWWSHDPELKMFIDEAISEVINGFFIKKDVILMDSLGKEHVYTLSMFSIRDDIGTLDYIATTGNEITDRIEMESKLEGLSKTDLLTQTFNRRGMYEILDQSVSLYKRKKTPFVILICDIDFFKNVNDTYGHMVGDEILSGLVVLLKKSARPYDVVGRWGGEEFTILLQDTTEEEGVFVAERIRKMVSQHPFKSDLTQHVIYISLTIGLKSYDSEYDIRQILKMADDALYHGKNNGRNQVVNYEHMMSRDDEL